MLNIGNAHWWLAALVALGVMLWRARGKRRRLRELAEFADALEIEKELPPLPASQAGALGNLQRSLSRAAQTLGGRLRNARAEQHRLEAVLGGMVEGVLVIDAAGTVLLSNRRAAELLDLVPDEPYVGRPLIELTRHPDLHQLVHWVMSERGLDRSSAQEIALDGSRQHVLQVTATPLEGGPGSVRTFILVFHDISELKRLERIRRDFVANVSHELRTPLAAIGGYTETLLSGAVDDPERARRFLGIIERHTERLGRLVDDLLTLSDLELGRTELQRGSIRVESVVGATFEVLRHKAASAGITLQQSIPAETPPLDADADRLEQALLNLVDNSIKYTPRGGHVAVSVRTVQPSEVPESVTLPEGGGFVEIAVADTGVGVPPEDLPRLTERFYRVDKARSRELGGTGLGLAIVKHVVQAHGGWMRIESELHHGTVVRLCIPAFAERGGQAAAAESEKARAT